MSNLIKKLSDKSYNIRNKVFYILKMAIKNNK